MIPALMHPDIGFLNGGRCYVFLEGHGLHREPMYGTYAECLCAIEARGGVDDPIPTDGVVTMADYMAALAAMAPATPEPLLPVASASFKDSATKKSRTLREYVLTFTTTDQDWANVDGYRTSSETVFAFDRNDAMRQGRDILLQNVGRFGPKIKLSAQLMRE